MRRRSELIKENWGRRLHSFSKEIMGSIARLGFRNSAGHFPGCSRFHGSAWPCSALEQSLMYRLWVPGPLASWPLARCISGEPWEETYSEREGETRCSPHFSLTSVFNAVAVSPLFFQFRLPSSSLFTEVKVSTGQSPTMGAACTQGALSSE